MKLTVKIFWLGYCKLLWREGGLKSRIKITDKRKFPLWSPVSPTELRLGPVLLNPLLTMFRFMCFVEHHLSIVIRLCIIFMWNNHCCSIINCYQLSTAYFVIVCCQSSDGGLICCTQTNVIYLNWVSIYNALTDTLSTRKLVRNKTIKKVTAQTL